MSKRETERRVKKAVRDGLLAEFSGSDYPVVAKVAAGKGGADFVEVTVRCTRQCGRWPSAAPKRRKPGTTLPGSRPDSAFFQDRVINHLFGGV